MCNRFGRTCAGGWEVAVADHEEVPTQFQLFIHCFRRVRSAEGSERFVGERCSHIERYPASSGVAGLGYDVIPGEVDGVRLGPPPHLLHTQHINLVASRKRVTPATLLPMKPARFHVATVTR